MSKVVPNNQISIRHATEKDLNTIVKVEKSAFPPERQATIETFRSRLNLFPSGFFVLLYKGKIVGLTTALITDEINTIKDLEYADKELFKKTGNSYELRSLAIMKPYQGRGLGTLLVKRQVENAKRLKKKYFFFTAASDVEPFYRQLGFKQISPYLPFHNSQQALYKVKINETTTLI